MPMRVAAAPPACSAELEDGRKVRCKARSGDAGCRGDVASVHSLRSQIRDHARDEFRVVRSDDSFGIDGGYSRIFLVELFRR